MILKIMNYLNVDDIMNIMESYLKVFFLVGKGNEIIDRENYFG